VPIELEAWRHDCAFCILDRMGSTPREQAEGLYHVAARSNAEEHIFRDERDYIAGITILADLVGADLLECHEFCFMPTHYHLLASFEAGGISKALQRLNRRYAGGFNKRHGRRGRVFDSPYASVLVEDDRHLLWLARYIANNPSSRPWPYSSHDSYFSFVDPTPLIDAFGSERRWREFASQA
jgi:REP element-mobilizing transposase RayT